MFGSTGQTIQFSGFQCAGTEANLGECTSNNSPPSTCTTATLAGVKCTQIGTCEAAGHTSCCTTFPCNVGSCYCDSSCYIFLDCCPDTTVTCPQGKFPHYSCSMQYLHCKGMLWHQWSKNCIQHTITITLGQLPHEALPLVNIREYFINGQKLALRPTNINIMKQLLALKLLLLNKLCTNGWKLFTWNVLHSN